MLNEPRSATVEGSTRHTLGENGFQLDDQLQKRLEGWLNAVPSAEQCSTAWSPHVALGTAQGLVRSDNQDRCLLLRAAFARSPERSFTLALVSDGMGGMARGGDAASLAASVLVTSLVRSKDASADGRLRSAVRAANDAVYKLLLGEGGATISAILIDADGQFTAANVGDSRIYEVQRTEKIVQVTTDDTLSGHLRQAAVPLDADRAELHQLVQYVGMGAGIEPHIPSLSSPYDSRYIVITSDGAHSCPPEMFSELLRNSASANEIVQRLLTTSEWLGGRDNATAVAINTETPHSLLAQHNNGAAVVEIWSPFGKVEFWGLPMVTEDPDERARNEQLAKDSRRSSIAGKNPKSRDSRQSKSGRSASRPTISGVEAKTPKGKKKRGQREAQRPERPQLDIRFSSNGTPTDGSEDS